MDREEMMKEIRRECAKIPNCDYKNIPLCRECTSNGKLFEYRTDEEILRLTKTLNTPGEDDYRVKALSEFCDKQSLCDECHLKCDEMAQESASECSFGEMDETLIDDLYERLMSLEKPEADPAADANKENDMVDNPEHYTFGGIETVDYLRAKLTKEEFVGWCRGNALKYLSRAGHKDEELQEYRKAAKYIEWIIDAMKE